MGDGLPAGHLGLGDLETWREGWSKGGPVPLLSARHEVEGGHQQLPSRVLFGRTHQCAPQVRVAKWIQVALGYSTLLAVDALDALEICTGWMGATTEWMQHPLTRLAASAGSEFRSLASHRSWHLLLCGTAASGRPFGG